LGGLRGTATKTTLPVVSFTPSGITTTVNYNAPSSSTVSFSTPYTPPGTYDVVGKGLAGTSAINQTYQMHPTPMSGVLSLIYRP
jgi:hypothetical protein